MSVNLRLVAVASAVIVATGACFIDTGSDDSGQSAPGSPAPGTTAPGNRAEQPSTDEFEEDLKGAVGGAEEYWGQVFQRSGIRFSPVRQIIPYEEEGEVDCGGEAIPKNNAVYCPAGDFIAYDVNFAVTAFAKIGDAFLYYLLGHEYGHGIQVRLGIQYSYTIEQELQADCMAGAYIGDSVKSGVLTIEEGDIDEFREGLLAVGDDPSIPWFTPGAHGTAEQRASSFFGGYERSLPACDLPRG
jgi:predicted metalloprotease